MNGLRYPLIADETGEIARAYGAFREDWSLAGRATFVIGEDGIVLKTYPRAPLDGKGHAEAVHDDLKAILS